ncbi:MAG: hypothetical protein R3C49_07740 [Planctomycetaceae bacterium]
MTQLYRIDRTWEWNLRNSPLAADQVQDGADEAAIPSCDTSGFRWCGLPVASPLGIAAGPLLNSGWLLQAANEGFDILVYKTVRSQARSCYPLPNLVPVDIPNELTGDQVLQASATMSGSWAVSFGMPSQSSDVWTADVQFARRHLPAGKVLVVSVVGTQDPTITDPRQSLEALADDFALCARMAVESGADGIEANFSCPNVSTTDGQLYQNPEAAGLVSQRIRNAIGQTPLVLKIGRVTRIEEAAALVQHTAATIHGLAMTNSVTARVCDESGRQLFGGERRGICGDAIRTASLEQTTMFRKLLQDRHRHLDLIGVGGISTFEHVQEYLAAGAQSVGIATAAMRIPNLGVQLKTRFTNWNSSFSDR